MTTNAFGVEVGSISKKERKEPDWGPHGKPSVGRVVTGAMAPGVHGLIAGAPGHKMRAAGREVGESAAGTVAGTGVAYGTAAGLHRVGVPGPLASEIGSDVGSGIVAASGIHSVMGNQKKGRYKKQRPNALGLSGKKPKTVAKAFQDDPIEKGLGAALKVGVDAAKGGVSALKGTKAGIKVGQGVGAAKSTGLKLMQKPAAKVATGGFRATRVGVAPSSTAPVGNKVAAHLGIGAGHAATAGGAAMGVGGIAVGAGAMHHHNKGTLVKAFREEIAKSEWKTIHQRERSQSRNRKAAVWSNTAAITGAGMGLYHGATRTQHARAKSDAKSAFMLRREVNAFSGAGAPKTPAALGAAKAGDVARGASAYIRGAKKGSLRTALALGVGGTAVSGGLYGKNAYHQHKINERRRKRMG